MKKKFKRREKKEVMDIDITSLLDILVILLVFLLKSYNASSLKLDLVKDLDMGQSDQRKLGNHALIIQVDKDENIWVKHKKVASTADLSGLSQFFEEEKQNREPAAMAKVEEGAKGKGKVVNLVFDKELEYGEIQKVMNICAQNMYTQFKLIVKGNY